MVHHRRSPSGKQRRAAKQFIYDGSRHDRLKGETINLVTVDDVAFMLAKTFGAEALDPDAVPKVEKGLVLADPHGQGAFQQPE